MQLYVWEGSAGMDLTTIQTALGLATTLIGATGQAASTVEKIKQIISTDKAPDNGEVQKLLNALATDLTATNMMNVQLSQALKVVSAELKQQDDFETQKARYELFETAEHDFVFRLREDMAEGQPIHFVCPVCLNRDSKFSYLRKTGDILRCQSEKTHHFVFTKTPRQTPTVRGGRSIW